MISIQFAPRRANRLSLLDRGQIVVWLATEIGCVDLVELSQLSTKFRRCRTHFEVEPFERQALFADRKHPRAQVRTDLIE